MAHPKTLLFAELSGGVDGVDFINVYSKAQTILGRALSNFASTPFILNGIQYKSVEGFWYHISTGSDEFIPLHGFEAKKIGKTYTKINEPTHEQLRAAYKAKLQYNAHIGRMLLENNLPFAHFYVFGGKPVSADKYLWTVDLWRELTDELK